MATLRVTTGGGGGGSVRSLPGRLLLEGQGAVWQLRTGTQTRWAAGTAAGTRGLAAAGSAAGSGSQEEHVLPQRSPPSVEQRRRGLHHHLVQHQARVEPLLRRGRGGRAVGLGRRARRRLAGRRRGSAGGRGAGRGGRRRLRPVGVLADVLVHVADGDVERAARLAAEVVPPGDVDGLQLALRQAGGAGVEPREELRKLVHQLEPEGQQEEAGERACNTV